MCPMRTVRARQYDALNRWVAVADMKTAPEMYMRTPPPDDQAMCELFMSLIEAFDGTVYRLSLAAYHPHVEATNNIHLDRFVGSPDDDDTLLWVRRLPPQQLLRFAQPLDFVAKLVGGMSDIPVRPFSVEDITSQMRMVCWARDVLASFALHNHQQLREKKMIVLTNDGFPASLEPFAALRPWIINLRALFVTGFAAHTVHNLLHLKEELSKDTLADNITFDKFVATLQPLHTSS
ncbi:hypothetical protein B0H19DRAFT_1056211 [Mycena capillaripes]|nr:hypothetical protein B0H19DRAFT_1056211 [Mycena capillaripes]